jgi:hypothetical protein
MLAAVSLRLVRASGLAVLVVGAAACAPPDTSERGFGSTQVQHVRDTELSLRSFALGETGIYLAHGIPDVTVSSGVATPYDRTLITFATGAEQPIAPGVLNVQLLPSADGLGRTSVIWHFPSDDVIPATLTAGALPYIDLTFLDEVTGAALTLSGVDSRYVDLGTTRSDPILVRRKGTDANDVLSMGLPESLAPMPSGINRVLGRDRLGFVGTTRSSAGTDTLSFTRIPFDGSAPLQLVPGTVTIQQAVSADGEPPFMASPSTVPGDWDGQGISCPAPTVSNPAPPCALFYDRSKPDRAGHTPVVNLLDAGTDFELPGQLAGRPNEVMRVAPTGWDAFWPAPSSVTTRLYAWHVGQDHAASCVRPGEMPLGGSAWRPLPEGGVAGATTAAQFALLVQPGSQTSEKRGSWTLVAGTTGVECHVVAPGSNLISQMFYAPDGSALALLETDPIGVSKVYVTDGDAATPPRVVATGAYFFNIDFHDPRHLLLWHSNTDGYSVSWLDLSSTPAVEHPIADRVRWDARGSWAWVNSRWVLLADSDSTQDGSYSLNVVDLETGTRRLVSRGVVDFRVPWSTPPAGATTLTVAYVVRSRAPSSQDGLWMAQLSLSDFPP